MGIGLEGIGSGSEDSEGGVRALRTFRGGGSSDDSEGVRALRTFRGGGSSDDSEGGVRALRAFRGGGSSDSDSEDSGGGAFLGLVRLLRGVGAGFGTLRLGVGGATTSSTGSATSSTTASTIATGLGRFLLPGGRPGLRVAIFIYSNIFSIRMVAEYRLRT